MSIQTQYQQIEEKWQTQWAKVLLNVTPISEPVKPFYNLMMFPYPSAEGLHVGNMYAFTGSDIYGRYKRMQGYTVFQPIGLDGFGIHSENYALKIGRHPFEHAEITEKNFYAQLKRIGAMYDWTKTVETYKTNYYKFTQWMFVQLFKQKLVYRSSAQVNWCPSCKTVLADEQVIDGSCERCGTVVEKKDLLQWFFRITAYAQNLDKNIKDLQWSEKVKIAQKNWIGKKEGINITYPLVDKSGKNIGSITCFTTRPDTNFGATFVVLAPEHPIIKELLHLLDKKQTDAIEKYLIAASSVSEMDRIAQGRIKTGVFTGLFCENYLTGEKMPVYISDFVLMNFGTGVVVGVPGHDLRDFEFAKVFDLPVKRVVVASDGNRGPIRSVDEVQEDEGTMINSDFLNGTSIHEATEKMMDYLEKNGWGKRKIQYHLRDWLISRQRYWGPPIPMIFCQSCAEKQQSWFSSKEAQDMTSIYTNEEQNDVSWAYGWYPVPENELPVALPHIDDYRPGDDGVPPLAKHKEFYETKCPECGEKATRSTEVSDTFLDSSWYFLRYPSVGNDSIPFDASITKTWLPVDMYTGGAEHSVLHLMYSRFITMALHDMGYLTFEEPFSNFFAHGLVIKDGAKMSKSKGNVVNPDEYIQTYGSDALRCYLMFMGSYSDGGDFRDSAMEGMYKWIGRVVRMYDVIEKNKNVLHTNEIILKSLHRLIKKVGEDIERRHYNTAIAAMMEFTNLVSEKEFSIHIDDIRIFLMLLAPFAPHISEELYQRSYGRTTIDEKVDSIHFQSWPLFTESLLEDDSITIVIQVNGKLRGDIIVSSEQAGDKEFVSTQAQKVDTVKRYLISSPKKVIFIPKKLVNFVV